MHMQHFGVPGKTLAGSDSHTCAAGSLGMLAIGTGGLEVALAMAGRPLHLTMPRDLGRAADRGTAAMGERQGRHPGDAAPSRRQGRRRTGHRVPRARLASLTAMDRHVIANMGAELGATTTVFPSDEAVRDFLAARGGGTTSRRCAADPDARYDLDEEIDLSALEPLIARPTSPGNVVPVREVAGEPVDQVVIGSSANPGLRDFAVAAAMVARTADRDRGELRHQSDLPGDPPGPDRDRARCST